MIPAIYYFVNEAWAQISYLLSCLEVNLPMKTHCVKTSMEWNRNFVMMIFLKAFLNKSWTVINDITTVLHTITWDNDNSCSSYQLHNSKVESQNYCLCVCDILIACKPDISNWESEGSQLYFKWTKLTSRTHWFGGGQRHSGSGVHKLEWLRLWTRELGRDLLL